MARNASIARDEREAMETDYTKSGAICGVNSIIPDND
jgi:hypothetical protein